MKPRSLILVTVDCLRADHVGFLGYSRPVTPFLDSLAEKSAVWLVRLLISLSPPS
jgi:glucan phosphoethanolaminetransferase (alkaline phosphatase superfamily)